PGRPLYAAHADQPVPREAHLTLWYAATLLREHRGDSHVAALGTAGLDGLEALVSHSATDDGMPRDLAMTTRGWTTEDWSAAEDRLRERGLMDGDGSLTEQGRRLRLELEEDTDRRDRVPYEHLGVRGVADLTELAAGFVRAAGTSGAFPAELEASSWARPAARTPRAEKHRASGPGAQAPSPARRARVRARQPELTRATADSMRPRARQQVPHRSQRYFEVRMRLTSTICTTSHDTRS
ncbi:SCO6745 family protein, partial [Streptomyces sparsus]